MNQLIKTSIRLTIALTVIVNGVFARENVGGSGLKNGNSTVFAGCNSPSAKTDLDINNVRAMVLTGGDMWWDLSNAKYEVPKNSGKQSIFAGALWIGGLDGAGNIKIAAQTYRQTGDDFWPGAIDLSVPGGQITEQSCQYYDRHWKITKEQVLDFINGGTPSKDIKEWPGNGRAAYFEDQQLAPFFDADSNGIYDVSKGDYPLYNLSGVYPGNECNDYVFGDQTLWWVFNDVGNVHTETGGDKIGLEIRAQAFAFKTNDEINNMTFYKYKIVNRSTFVLDSTYFGVWVDPDLGNYEDDYVGCDVSLGLGFVYNGDEDDDGATGYGLNPPSCGVDFFQGPIADAGDGIDNDKDGTIDEPGEQIIMSKYVYYNNVNGTFNGNPNGATHFYNYLKGIWGNGQAMTFGEDGTNPLNPLCEYMFPGTTDPAFPGQNWTEASSGNPTGDRRFIQSAGKFTLQPGAVNWITTGVVWARSNNGGVQGSINLMKTADVKAQQIFDNCFKVLDGPNAPDLAIRELSNKVILTIENYNNDKVENYFEIDPTIPEFIPNDQGGVDTLSIAERSYAFEGYMIFQLKDFTITSADMYNPDKARLVAQVDVKNGVGQIVNNTWDESLNYWVPEAKVLYNLGPDLGIKHTFEVDKDLFATGNSQMVNNKSYYFTIVSYAYNNFRTFVPTVTPSPNYTQGRPFFQGRLNIRTYSATPHSPSVENNGQVFNSDVGTTPAIVRIEGQGNGGNVIDMDQASIDEALNGPDFRSYNPTYVSGKVPASIAVYDPVKVKAFPFELKFDGVSDNSLWTLKNLFNNDIDVAERGLSVINQQVLSKYGLVATIFQVKDPDKSVENAGFLEATITSEKGEWLEFMADNNALGQTNWIRPSDYPNIDPDSVYITVLGGRWAPFKLLNKSTSDYSPKWNNPALDASVSGLSLSRLASVDIVITNDKSKWTRSPVFEVCNVPANTQPLGSNVGKFDLRKSASINKDGTPANVTDPPSENENDPNYIGSTGMSWFPGYAINIETGERLNIAFGENSRLDADMKFNPTSFINDLTGDTVIGNMHYIYVFGHNKDSTVDMPRYDAGRFIRSILNTGGNLNNKKFVWKDCMWASVPLLTDGKSWNDFYNGDQSYGDIKVRLRVGKSYKEYDTRKEKFAGDQLEPNTAYKVLMDTINYNGVDYKPSATFTTDNSTLVFSGTGSVVGGPTQNNNFPYYKFNTDALATVVNNQETAKSALDIINIVPNPYYAYSSYERTQYETQVKITNLPAKCTISIFTLNGTLIKTIKRDVAVNASTGQPDNSEGGEILDNDTNTDTAERWDLKNSNGIAIASGVYIIHIDADGFGEKVLKFFCVQRPTDVSIF